MIFLFSFLFGCAQGQFKFGTKEGYAFTQQLFGATPAPVPSIPLAGCKFVVVDNQNVQMFYQQRGGDDVTVEFAVPVNRIAGGGWFAVGRADKANSMTSQSVVMAWLDSKEGKGYVAEMAFPQDNGRKPPVYTSVELPGAAIGVEAESGDLAIVRFTVPEKWGSSTESLFFAFGGSDTFTGAPVPPVIGAVFEKEKHAATTRLERFDFTVEEQCIPARVSNLAGVPLRADVLEACKANPKGEFQVKLGEGTDLPVLTITIRWTHDCTMQTTRFVIDGTSVGWLAIGLKNGDLDPKEVMIDCDFYMFNQDELQDAFLVGNQNAQPEVVAEANRIFIGTPSVRTIEGRLTGIFTRPWDAVTFNDPHAQLAAVQPLNLLVAINPNSGEFGRQHAKQYAKTFPETLRLFDASAPIGDPSPAPPAGPADPCEGVDSFSNEFDTEEILGNPVNVKYTVDCKKDEIEFTVTATVNDGWVAFAFNEKSAMDGCDTYQVGAPDDEITVRNGRADGYQLVEDGIIDSTGTIKDGVLTVTFKRNLESSGDKTIGPGKVYFVHVAANEDNADFEAKHDVFEKGKKEITLWTAGDVTDVVSPGTPKPETDAPKSAPGGEAPAGGNPCDSQDSFANELNLPLDVTMAYTVDCKAETMDITLSAEHDGWVALGFNEQNQMGGTDVYQVLANGGEATVRRVTAKGTSLDEGSAEDKDVIDSSFVDGKTSVTFSRTFKAEGANGFDLSFEKPLYLLTAIGGSDVTKQHAKREVTGDKVQLFKSDGGDIVVGASPAKALFLVHGILMILAWGSMSVVATFFARYLKDLGPPWYSIHRGMMSAVVACTILGFVLILVQTGGTFDLVHGFIGIFIVVLAIVQPILGILANRWWSPDRSGTPIFPDIVHWWLGRFLLLLGFVNCMLGVATLHDRTLSATGPGIIVVALLALVLIAFFVVGQVKIGAVHHNADDNGATPDSSDKPDVQVWRNISFGVLALTMLLGILSVVLAEKSFVASFN